MVSIICPIYNTEKYIENTMKSICSLEYRDIEIVLVNDGSTDSSVEIATKILENCNMDFKVINQNNKGLPAARNTGIRNAKGDWFVCVDSDDILCKKFLSVLEHSYSEVVITNFKPVKYDNIFEQPRTMFKNRILQRENALNEFLKRKLRIVVPAMIMKTEYFLSNDLWFDEKALFGEDQPFIWSVLLSASSIEYNDTCLYNYFVHENSIMTGSEIKKIVSGYKAYQNFIQEGCKYGLKSDIITMIIPRWVFGVLRSTAKNRQKDKYLKLIGELEMFKYISKLLSFPDIRVKVFTRIFKISPMLFYHVAGGL